MKLLRTSLVAQMVKNLPAMHKTQVLSLGWEDPLEKGMAIHSSILRWEIPQTEARVRLQSMGLQRVGHNSVTFTFIFFTVVTRTDSRVGQFEYRSYQSVVV